MKKIFKGVISSILSVCLIFSCLGGNVMAYKNSFYLTEAPNGFGDPFIMKYNGIFYLYGVYNSKVRCWTSRDMVNWGNYHDNVLAEPPTNPIYDNPFAAEVFYFEGKFYMYGSPMGNGHYVYMSDSPLGPFSAVTNILDNKYIDGTLCVDSDGTIKFLCGGVGHISYANLTTPSTGFPETYSEYPISIANRWTEGPTLFKRNGEYYLTYTGNQVWEKNYRVEYAHTDNINNGFVEEEDNTILLNTEGEQNVALGHNSIIVGPDLDSYYIVYHDAYRFNGTSVSRNIDMDRIVWNGKKLCVVGPTVQEMPNPDMPDFYEYFDGSLDTNWNKTGSFSLENGYATVSGNGSLISKASTGNVFSAEYNIADGNAYCVFNYEDSNNYSRVYFSSDKKLKIEKIVNGISSVVKNFSMPSHFVSGVQHTLKVQQADNKQYFSVDGVEYCSVDCAENESGKIGYITGNGATVGFTAFSAKALGNEDNEFIKPVPSKIEAVHANNIDDGFTVVSATGNAFGNAVKVKKNQILKYNVDVADNNNYTIDLSLKDVDADTQIAVMVDGVIIKSVKGDIVNKSRAYTECCIRDVSLSKGKHEIGLYFLGDAEVYEINIQKYTSCENNINPISLMTEENLLEIPPIISHNSVKFTDSTTYGKAMLGTQKWGDYCVSASVKISDGETAGFLLRTTDCFTGYRDNPKLDDKYYQRAYYVGFSRSESGYKLVLEKHKISEYTTLASTNPEYNSLVEYNLKVEVLGSKIRAYINGSLVLDYDDGYAAYTVGTVGLRSIYSISQFNNITVTPLDGLENGNVESPIDVYDYTKAIMISPDDFAGNGFQNKFARIVDSSESDYGKAIRITMETGVSYKETNAFLNSILSSTVPVRSGTYTLKLTAEGKIPRDTYIFVKNIVDGKNVSSQSKSFKGKFETKGKNEIELNNIELIDGSAEIMLQFWANSTDSTCDMTISDIVLVPKTDYGSYAYYEAEINVPSSVFNLSSYAERKIGGVYSNERLEINGVTNGIAISTPSLSVPNGTYTLHYYVKNTGGQSSVKFMANVNGVEYYDQMSGFVSEDWTVREINNIPVTSGKMVVMFWYVNSDSNAKFQIDGITLLREANKVLECDQSFNVEYSYDKESDVPICDFTSKTSGSIEKISEKELELSKGGGYFYKNISNLENGTYSAVIDMMLSSDTTGNIILKANPGDSTASEKRSATLSDCYGCYKQVRIDGINVTNGKLFFRVDYSVLSGNIRVRNLKLLRVGTTNYLDVKFSGITKATEKNLLPIGDSITLSAESNYEIGNDNYRFVGWYNKGVRIGEETSLEFVCKNDSDITKKYVLMADGLKLYDTNGDGTVDVLDLVRIKKHLANNTVEIKTAAADVNGDDVIDSIDFVSIRKRLLSA